MFDDIQQSMPIQHLTTQDGVSVSMKRLDLVHPQISGNKFFKLKYTIQDAIKQNFPSILTFGGAYSNHILATAYAAKHGGLKSIGVIRGEELKYSPYNHTLAQASEYGMQFHFVSRAEYKHRHDPVYLEHLQQIYPDTYVIPEGGTNALAIQGCQDILSASDLAEYDVICVAVGTGGTITGLIESSTPQHHILGFSALKGDFLTHDVAALTSKTHWSITDQYCFGGYAKSSNTLTAFIDAFEQRYDIPLEPIYTGKMMYGLFDLIEQSKFQSGIRILAIHSGGLQGRAA